MKPSRTNFAPATPMMIWDGECSFCRLWIDWWKRRTGDCVSYQPLQIAGFRFQDVPAEGFKEAVAFIAPDGSIFWGAGAVFASLKCKTSLPLIAYKRIKPFRWLSEKIYHLVSVNRDGLYWLSRKFKTPGGV